MIGVLTLGLAIAVVLVVVNTIRLAIESRREEIVVMKIVGGTEITGWSSHHQAWDGLADGLVRSATADDQIIEAFESTDGSILGLQWHPEVDAADDPIQQAPFDWLVGQAQNSASRGGSR